VVKKKSFVISILLILSLLIFTGCSPTINVKNKEVKEFSKSILKADKQIKELKFYFRRPSLNAELVYDDELSTADLQFLIAEFKTLINVEFMQKIGDKYWGKGARPSGFNLYIYVGKKKDESGNDYLVMSRYNKTHVINDDPANIDGYKTWDIWAKNDKIILE